MKSIVSTVKKYSVHAIAFSLLFVPAARVLAAGGSTNIFSGGAGNTPSGGATNNGTQGIQNPIGAGDLQTFVTNILNIFVLLGSIVIVFFIIYAGLQYVLARGNQSAIEKAHKTLLYTVIGAAIILGAQVISVVIQNTIKDLAS